MNPFSEQAARIRKKILQAAKVDTNFQVFGASSHRYVLNPPVSEAKVLQFEAQYRIQLPACYRTFLTEVGNGGAGPFYGIYPLGKDINEFCYDESFDFLRNDCMLYPKMTDEYWDAFVNKLENEDDAPYETLAGVVFGGLLPIGHQGCTYYHVLVLNGIWEGKVVNMDYDLQKPKFTFDDNFLDWHERWLDEIIIPDLRRNEGYWFGYTLGGSVEQLWNQYKNSSDQIFQEDCLIAINRLAHLSKAILALLENEFLNDKGKFKRLLLQILCEQHHPKIKVYLTEYAKTDFSEVAGLIHHHFKKQSADYLDLIKEHIGTVNDGMTFSYCCFVLQKMKRDYGLIILPFASHENDSIRGTCIWALGELFHKEQYMGAFIKGLQDESLSVVRNSLQALKGIKDNRLLVYYKKIAVRFPVEQDYILSNLEQRLTEYGYNLETIKDYAPSQLPITGLSKLESFWVNLLRRLG